MTLLAAPANLVTTRIAGGLTLAWDALSAAAKKGAILYFNLVTGRSRDLAPWKVENLGAPSTAQSGDKTIAMLDEISAEFGRVTLYATLAQVDSDGIPGLQSAETSFTA